MDRPSWLDLLPESRPFGDLLGPPLPFVEDFRLVQCKDAPFFHEFVVRTPVPAADVNARLLEQGIIGGFDLGRVSAELADHLLLCCTELNDRESIDRFVAAVPR